MLKISIPSTDSADFERTLRVLRSGQLSVGRESALLEHAFAEYLGIQDTAVVSSGTAALWLSAYAQGIGQGDLVLVAGFSFVATVNVPLTLGADVGLVDVDPDTYVITTDTLQVALDRAAALKQTPKALILVHEFGQVVDPAVRTLAQDKGIVVIEDAACALGARSNTGVPVGQDADLCCFSLHPRKLLTTAEGGVITAKDPHLLERIKRLRSHGVQRNQKGITFTEPGFNFKLSDVHASIGHGQLSRLDERIAQRQKLASIYHEALNDLADQGIVQRPKFTQDHAWQTYMIRLSHPFQRNQVQRQLYEREIESNVGAQDLSALIYMAEVRDQWPTPHAQSLGMQGLALPFCDAYGAEDVSRVVSALTEICTHTQSVNP